MHSEDYNSMTEEERRKARDKVLANMAPTERRLSFAMSDNPWEGDNPESVIDRVRQIAAEHELEPYEFAQVLADALLTWRVSQDEAPAVPIGWALNLAMHALSSTDEEDPRYWLLEPVQDLLHGIQHQLLDPDVEEALRHRQDLLGGPR